MSMSIVLWRVRICFWYFDAAWPFLCFFFYHLTSHFLLLDHHFSFYTFLHFLLWDSFLIVKLLLELRHYLDSFFFVNTKWLFGKLSIHWTVVLLIHDICQLLIDTMPWRFLYQNVVLLLFFTLLLLTLELFELVLFFAREHFAHVFTMKLDNCQSLSYFRSIFLWLYYHMFLILSVLMLFYEGQRIFHPNQQ